MKITDNERMVLNQFNAATQFYSFWDGGYVATDSGTYQSEFIPEMAKAMGKPESSARPVLNSLVKKGIFTVKEVEAEEPIMTTDGETEVQPGKPADHWVELTEAGVELIADLRLEEDEAMLADDMEDDDDEPEMQTKSIASLAADARVKAAKEAQGRKAAAKADIASTPGLRTSHANCDHPTQGKEGKMARAKCRRERAAAAKALEEKEAKKAERAAKKAAAHVNA